MWVTLLCLLPSIFFSLIKCFTQTHSVFRYFCLKPYTLVNYHNTEMHSVFSISTVHIYICNIDLSKDSVLPLFWLLLLVNESMLDIDSARDVALGSLFCVWGMQSISSSSSPWGEDEVMLERWEEMNITVRGIEGSIVDSGTIDWEHSLGDWEPWWSCEGSCVACNEPSIDELRQGVMNKTKALKTVDH